MRCWESEGRYGNNILDYIKEEGILSNDGVMPFKRASRLLLYECQSLG